MTYQASGKLNAGRPEGIPISGLTPAEQFVLGVCRCWDAFMDDPDPAALAWRELTPVFAYMNVMSSLCAFERAITALHRHPLRTLRFHAVDSPQVGADEQRLLCALACLQRGDPLAAIRVLRGSLTHYGVRSVLPPLARIAAVLDLQGHRLPAWHCEEQNDLKRTPGQAPQDEISSQRRCQVR